MLLSHMVCNALVAGGRRSGAGQQAIQSRAPDDGNISARNMLGRL